MSLNAYEVPEFQYSLPATTDIAAHRFVSINSNGEAIQATASTPVIGVSRNTIDTAKYPNNQVLDFADGIMVVEAAGAVTCGDAVSSDADGKAIKAASASAGIGIAFTTATAAGSYVSVRL